MSTPSDLGDGRTGDAPRPRRDLRRVASSRRPRAGSARRSDVDRDGRFTVLFSSWLTRLAGGKASVDGFVRGADLDLGLGAPFGNRCDMMYLSTALTAGPHLRTILAHEYTHAVNFSRKALADQAEPASRKKAGSTRGSPTSSRTPTASRGRTSTTASAPSSRSPSAIAWSSTTITRPTSSGATATGGRPTCSSAGASTATGRACSTPWSGRSDRGVANLEAATGSTFADLFRRWTVALLPERARPDLGARGGVSVDRPPGRAGGLDPGRPSETDRARPAARPIRGRPRRPRRITR